MVGRKLAEMGVEVAPTPDGVRVRRDGPLHVRSTCRRCRSPGSRPTSCRSPCRVLATADGTAIVTENIFDNRFAFVDELNRMGADIRTEGRHAVVRGVRPPLRGPGPGPRRAGRRRAGDRRPGRRRRDRWCSTRTTSTAATPTCPAKLPRPRRRRASASVDGLTAGRPEATRAQRGSAREGVGYWRCCTRVSHPPTPSEHSHAPPPPAWKPTSSRRSRPSGPRCRPTAVTSSSRRSTTTASSTSSLVGACGTCPVSTMTLKAGVERIIMDRVPGITAVEADNSTTIPSLTDRSESGGRALDGGRTIRRRSSTARCAGDRGADRPADLARRDRRRRRGRARSRRLYPHTGAPTRSGSPARPGAGKSTLTDRLIGRVPAPTGDEVGVLAVDPTSPFTGGAILGDRVRMQDHATDPGVFIRSMATRGHLGGLALATPQAVRVLDAAGQAVGARRDRRRRAGRGRDRGRRRHDGRRRQPGLGRRRAGEQGRAARDRRRVRRQQGRPGRCRRHGPRPDADARALGRTRAGRRRSSRRSRPTAPASTSSSTAIGDHRAFLERDGRARAPPRRAPARRGPRDRARPPRAPRRRRVCRGATFDALVAAVAARELDPYTAAAGCSEAERSGRAALTVARRNCTERRSSSPSTTTTASCCSGSTARR